jgi:putative sigma-54 modulation protein
MELEFTFRNLESTDAIKGWANKRFKKVEKYLSEPSSAHLTLTVDKHRHRAEMTVTSAGEVLRSSEETDDMYTSMDKAMEKVEAAAQRQKERTHNHRH